MNVYTLTLLHWMLAVFGMGLLNEIDSRHCRTLALGVLNYAKQHYLTMHYFLDSKIQLIDFFKLFVKDYTV